MKLQEREILDILERLPSLQVVGLSTDARSAEVSVLYIADLNREVVLEVVSALKQVFYLLKQLEEAQ